MPAREPHAILGVPTDATPAQVKAAWRRLARENHPDLTSGDEAQARRATRRMAEINAAYELLRDGGVAARSNGTAARHGRSGAAGAADRDGRAAGANGRADGRAGRAGPAARARPVTGRVDTTGTFRARNTTTTPPGTRHPLSGMPGSRAARIERDLRASDPTGPLRRVRRRRRRRPDPSLVDARALVLEFGKFRGHTLGEVAAFEPSYVDWLARAIANPDLVAASRVVQADLDARGVKRRDRSTGATRPPAASQGSATA